MAISNCLFSYASENPCFDKLNNSGFSAWCVLAKLSDNPRNNS